MDLQPILWVRAPLFIAEDDLRSNFSFTVHISGQTELLSHSITTINTIIT